jgi:tetratricopeptide (TPR) repeat protein
VTGRPSARGRSFWSVIAAAGALALATLPAHAQAGDPQLTQADEGRLLRDAAALEAAGDLPGSERALRAVLARTPGSLAALIALERVLMMQSRTAELIPAVEASLARDPKSPVAHQMRVRAFSALDRVEDLERAAKAWIAATPNIETPYREVARVWRQRHQLTRAVDVLELGRSRIRREDALALELGDVYAEAGDAGRAVREWNRAIGADGHGFLLVQRRISNLPNGGATLIPELVAALTREPTTLPRQRAATQIAIEAGLEAEAETIAREVAGSLERDHRWSFLVDVARRSDGAGLNRLAYWAYGQLLNGRGSDDQKLAIRTRHAELALAVGDTASAEAAYTQLERAFAVGSPQRRQAVAIRIELLARDGQVEQARAEYESFRREFPVAEELDAVAAAIANMLLDRGEHDAAELVLANVTGPQSGLARARILLRRGEVDRARDELLGSAPALHGAQATETIALATLLGRVSADGGELVGRAMARASGGAIDEAVTLLLDESESLPAGERPAVLEFAASLADRAQLTERAELVRREIVSEHEGAREAPAAMLALARTLMAEGRSPEEARVLLESIVLEHPRSPLVPQARGELDRLAGRVPGGRVP